VSPSRSRREPVLTPRRSGAPQLVSRERMFDAVDIILSLQNPCGGFASCELVRGPRWLELLNPAEVFRDIMVEIPYAECTTACTLPFDLFLTRLLTRGAIQASRRSVRSRRSIPIIDARKSSEFFSSLSHALTHRPTSESHALVPYTSSTPSNSPMDPGTVHGLSASRKSLLFLPPVPH
jgi:hypothetical protein